ncbi:MAG TPA: VWA domain-containing protein [Gemmatimonadales bacterium]|nr:VWA domain-containing protein [Gemmatimonadales bacterium]
MSFARPWLLLLLLFPFAWWWWRRSRPASGTGYSDLRLVSLVREARWLGRLPMWCRGFAYGAWVLAAAGPRLGGARVEQKKEGISIVIAVDISSSMLAEDFAPSNRLEVAKQQAIQFIEGRSADRIGAVAFAGEALTLAPITVDYPVLEKAISELHIGMLEDGTAIGTGLSTAINRLREAPGKSKVILLLTDGVNNRGTVDPRTAAAAAAALGIRVYTIGVGTEGEAPIPTGRGLSGFRYEVLPVEIDEDLLRDIAATTGARYFRAKDSEALSRIFKQIDGLEKTPIHVTRYVKYEEFSKPLVLVGLLGLALELLLNATLVVRTP